jgi:hypothetical protein
MHDGAGVVAIGLVRRRCADRALEMPRFDDADRREPRIGQAEIEPLGQRASLEGNPNDGTVKGHDSAPKRSTRSARISPSTLWLRPTESHMSAVSLSWRVEPVDCRRG